MGSFSTTIMNRISTTARQCNATPHPFQGCAAPAREPKIFATTPVGRVGGRSHTRSDRRVRKGGSPEGRLFSAAVRKRSLEGAAQPAPDGPVLRAAAAEK
jgi:hypothetical protein